MKFDFTEQQVNNLLVFMDRISLTGIKEVQAFNEIIAALNNPINEESNQQ